MEKRLLDVLKNGGENYILPFYWQHGESKELLEEGMEKIHDSGIGAVCVESRPHPDFLGESWWRDMDIIMEKARELNMRVWVLDDAHFPSGYCNGKISEDSPYGKTYLTHYTIDAVGPVKGNAFMVRLDVGERLIGVLLSRRDRGESFYQTQVQEVTDLVRDGKLYLDIPEGTWAITVIKTTRRGTGRKGYVNAIDKAAVRFFIDTVYEAHFSRYEKDFGGVFAGFFSDEPEIGNCLGEYVHDSYIGQPTMALPWCDELEERLQKQWGDNLVPNLLAMWVNTDENRLEKNRTGLLRRQFMEHVSVLYGANFCTQIGDWCRAHNVEYIGHVIEDGGSHSHLGLGTGHFFKALWGQDMSGIDVVLQQIRPQLDDFPFYSIGGRGFYHGEFFHYGLAKMGVSLGHLDAKKLGRTMCEVFGAYGWAEGVKLMKWILDHMLVRGVNHFVPHAFTMKDFPDPDCPPHFYARGKNPQYPYFRYLMEYTNRVSHLINGGVHVPVVALLYTAEQEWMGPVRKFEKDAKELTRGQIDFEVVPEDLLYEAPLKGGRLILGQESVSALVVPGSQCISEKLAEKCKQLMAEGIRVFFTEQCPKVLTEDGRMMDLEVHAIAEAAVTCAETLCVAGAGMLVNAADLVATLRALGICEFVTSNSQPWLRYYHYMQSKGEFWLFFNEGVIQDIDTKLKFNSNKAYSCDEVCAEPAGESASGKEMKEWWYDPWTNRLTPCKREQDGSLRLPLSTYEMKILYRGEADAQCLGDVAFVESNDYADDADVADGTIQLELDPAAWTLETLDSGSDTWEKEALSAAVEGAELPSPIAEGADFAGEMGTVLGDLSAHHRKPYFSGTMRYKTSFNWAGTPGMSAVLDLGEVFETAHVYLNGEEVGVRIAPPYQFEVTKFLHQGDNKLEILVTNTLVHSQRDYMSMTLPMEPSGLLGPVTLKNRKIG